MSIINSAPYADQLGENNKFADFLTKVFKKKIKRIKKSAEVSLFDQFIERNVQRCTSKTLIYDKLINSSTA